MFQQLQNSDPAQRRQAIIALANSGDPRALNALQKVSTSDSEPALRQLAERAVRHIESKQAQAAAPSAPADPNPPQLSPSDSSPPPGTASNWSQQIEQLNAASTNNIALARGQVNNAFGSYASGDKAGGRVYLARALALNPAQADNPEVRELAEKLTELPADDAIKLLSGPPSGSQPGAKVSGSGPAATSTTDSLLTLLLELALLFVVLVVSFMLSFTAIRQSAGSLTPPTTGSATANVRQAATEKAINQIVALGSSLVLVYAGIGAALGVVGFLVWNTLVNVFSVMALGGQGDWAEYLHAMLRIQIVGVIVGTVPIILPLLSSRASLAAQSNALSLATNISGIAAIGLLIAQIYYTSRVHKFDWLRGCIAVVLTPFIFSCGCAILLFVASSFGRLTTG